MDKTPTEILAEIASCLSLDDAMNTRNTSKKMHGIIDYSSRLNPFAYLGKTFKYSVSLLATMADTGSVLSGSRALEYFYPGSITPESDWDFYTPGDLASVYEMVSALRTSGVSWEYRSMKLRTFMRSSIGSTVELPLEELYQAANFAWKITSADRADEITDEVRLAFSEAVLAYEKLVRQLVPYGGVNYLRDNKGFRLRTTLKMQKTGEYTLSNSDWFTMQQSSPDEDGHEDSYADNESPTTVIRGSICVGGITERVQLMVCGVERDDYAHAPDGPLRNITEFYASHVQCFISGWCAMHLFPKETSKMKAIRWDGHANSATDTAIAKYMDRGYAFEASRIQYAFPANRISLLQKNVSYLDFGTFYEEVLNKENATRRTLATYMTTMRRALEMISWYKGPGRTIYMSVDKELCRLRDGQFDTGYTNVPEFRRLVCTRGVGTEDQISAYSPYSEKCTVHARGMRELLISGAVPMMYAGRPWRCLL